MLRTYKESTLLGKLIALFIGVPLIEVALLIQIGRWMGLLPTIALVVVTGVFGASLARSQGMRVLLQIQAELAAGRMPVARIIDGGLIFCAGILLLTPGLLTDIFGLAMLTPGPRQWIKGIAARRIRRLVESGRVVTIHHDSTIL